ncbi:MAG: glycosyltransferase family 2 protein [Candidatus Adiutrix sp.]|jgi:dolichol-phosphate mannosyltransferase|nr:glycosyltransferase family 2 protein [Candidatus Adiutrix sp.]
MAENDISVSVVIPFYNEAEGVEPLFERLWPVLEALEASYEVIAVNDGSRDETMERLSRQARRRPRLKVIDFARNEGQTAALQAGFDHAAGRIIVPMDADLQNDPADIPGLVKKLNEEGWDVVSGWRQDRKDAAIRRNLPSRLANFLISKVSGVPLHDYGCTLKAYRRSILEGVRLYGEMHRFIPIYASWNGAKVTEAPVRHHSRISGQSKYGLERVFKVLLDLLVTCFLDRYLRKPIYVFGGFGLFLAAASGFCALIAFILKFIGRASLVQTPLPLIAVMTFSVGISSILMGLLAEVATRTYFESQGRPPYKIRRQINFSENGAPGGGPEAAPAGEKV